MECTDCVQYAVKERCKVMFLSLMCPRLFTLGRLTLESCVFIGDRKAGAVILVKNCVDMNTSDCDILYALRYHTRYC